MKSNGRFYQGHQNTNEKKRQKKDVPSREARKQALGWDIWTNLSLVTLGLRSIRNEESCFVKKTKMMYSKLFFSYIPV